MGQDIQVCHGRNTGRYGITPRDLTSASHAELKKTQFRKANPTRRSLLLTPESETTEHQFYELEMEQKRKMEKQAALKRTAEGPPGMDVAFLEDDAAGDGADVVGSVLDIKQQSKAQRI